MSSSNARTVPPAESGAPSSTSSAEAQRLYAGFEPQRIVLRKHPGRIVAAVVVVLLAAALIRTVVVSDGFDWPTVGDYLFDPDILRGVWTTIYLTFLAMVVGIAVGVLAAVMRRSPNPLLSVSAGLFIWAFRGVPTLVQLLFWFNLAALFPTVGIGIPGGPMLWTGDPNDFMKPLLAALLGLGLCEGAYMAEIVRGGILSVDRGQLEAAAALGMSERATFRKVVFPQAMRSIIPATGNEVIGMLKYSSLASVISVTELLYASQQISNLTFQVIPLLIVASTWYLILATILQLGQRQLEGRFGRGVDTRRVGARARVSKAARTSNKQRSSSDV